jgi:biotin synthase
MKNMNFQALADTSIAGEILSREECLAVLQCPDNRILNLLAATARCGSSFVRRVPAYVDQC